MIKGYSSGIYNNYKYICTQHQNTKIYKAKINRTEGGIYSNTIVVGDFNTKFSIIDTISRQKINKDTANLNNTVDQTNLTDKFRTFSPTAVEYTFFSSIHGTLSRIDPM